MIMQFHHYQSICPKSYRGGIDKFLNDAIAGRLSHPDDAVNKFVGVLIEKAWRLVNRPYYNVYPIVEQLCNKTTLAVRWDQVSFPFSPLLFRFPAGHEPCNIASALVFTVPPASVPGFDYGEIPAFKECWACDSTQPKCHARPFAVVSGEGACPEAKKAISYVLCRTIVCVVQFTTRAGPLSLVWSTRSETWTETVEHTLSDKNHGGKDLLGGIDGERASRFLCRLSVLAALVGQGNDLISREILSRDSAKYENADDLEKRWIEQRAARVNGTGFSFGKELQRKSEVSPHWRNPHMALFHTGPNRSVPTLKLRSGCVVSKTPLSDIPTGFLDNEPDSSSCHTVALYSCRVSVPKRMRFRVMRRDGFRCQLCGLGQQDGVKLEVDHKVPVAKGGKTDERNLWTLCHPCNNGKSDGDLYISKEESRCLR